MKTIKDKTEGQLNRTIKKFKLLCLLDFACVDSTDV